MRATLAFNGLNEIVTLKISNSLLNLFQIDNPINVIFFWQKLSFLKGVSKAIYYLVLYGFWEIMKNNLLIYLFIYLDNLFT